MKRVVVLVAAVVFVLGGAGGAAAIDFRVQGEWDFYLNAGEVSMYKKPHAARQTGAALDTFDPVSRFQFQVEAVVSEDLFGVLQFEMGTYSWGQAREGARRGGAALGERNGSVAVKRAYLDWRLPGTELRFRMGLQDVALPNAAGGSAVLDNDVMAVAASYKFNERLALTAMWARPYNDNYAYGDFGGSQAGGAFDNIDLGMLAVPLTFDGFSAVPWAMFGMMGKNSARALFGREIPGDSCYPMRGLFPVDMGQGRFSEAARFSNAYSSMFWAGIPVTISAFDPFSFEFDLNYGYVSGFGRYDDLRAMNADGSPRRNDSRREGFVVKALAEYKMDWGVPGLFGWYGSGDSGDTGNGSGRMPYISPAGNFSSFGLAGYYGDFGSLQTGERIEAGYSGTWAIGAQIRELSFLDDLSHTLRVIYWRGTNDPAMARSLRNPLNPDGNDYMNTAWNNQAGGALYLTRNDYLVEFNLDSAYKIYENLEACLELGYIVNGMDRNTWKWSGNQKEDAWKASLILRYSF